ncbi:hypothetical protein CDD81_2138 [Ophiocordyceps australis]|uniref:DOMON domain-containing protein n=1 Tax=Ophiocordyceps australis TaxID=1399860 RepID=A0A2C5XZF2_9HYPO|nr:hypothetical protein CDD81_2138 [Ophiocordyceps australis]
MKFLANMALATALNAAATFAASAPFCPQADVCFRWAVPETNSSNIYMQLEAPTSFSWVGMGIGSQMRNADMLVMYAASATNITLSTRRGTGLVMPQHVARADVELLPGSGIANGRMRANVRCRGCRSAKLQRPAHWIAAWAQGKPLDSQDPAARIHFHDGFDIYTVDLARATVRADENPFVGVQGRGQQAVLKSNEDPTKTLVYAHGVLMTIIFAAGYPLGSILMPLLGKWLVHASWQIILFLGMWAGFGIGYAITHRVGTVFKSTHTQLGAAVCALMCLQPIFGYLHHLFYLKHRRRGAFSHVHIWYGRALMLIGIVNGGLGLQLAGNPRGFTIGYCVVAAVCGAAYLAAAVVSALRKPAPQPSPSWSRVEVTKTNSMS